MIARRQRFGLLLAAALTACGCHRGAPAGSIAVRPPFSESSEVLWLQPHWRAAGADSVEISFDADNRLHTQLYLRLANPRLLDGDGRAIAAGASALACRLAPGSTAGLLRATLPLAVGAAEGAALTVDALAIPLAEPGRALYREWAWLRRPREVAAIDAELRAYDAAPLCVSAPLAPGARAAQ